MNTMFKQNNVFLLCDIFIKLLGNTDGSLSLMNNVENDKNPL